MSNIVPAALTPEDLAALRRACAALENPSLAARLSNVLGTPVAQGLQLLPRRWYDAIQRGSERLIGRALTLAIDLLGRNPPSGDHDRFHRAMVIATGAAGGWFGLPGLLVELPVTTTIMLRGIADTAHRNGESLEDLDTRLACVEVFALGGRTHDDDFTELGYYEVRAALALHFTTVSLDALVVGAGARSLPATVSLVRAIAQRFGVVLSDKVAAQLVPVLGAAAGAAINTLFMQHFQTVADGHFTLRRLERNYGRERVEQAYAGLAREIASAQQTASAAAVAA